MKHGGAASGRGARGALTARQWLPSLAAAGAAVALALTLVGLLTSLSDIRALPATPAGVYFGWTDGHDGRFQVLADACGDAQVGADPVVSASLAHGGALVEFRPPAVDDAPADLVFAAAVPVLSFEPSALAALADRTAADLSEARRNLVETALSSLAVRCRNHAESSARLGSAAFVMVPATVRAGEQPPGMTPAIGVTSRRVPPTAGLLGVLVFSNDADEAIVLQALRIAPDRAGTGSVIAAAGDREMVAAWLGAVFGAPEARPLRGTIDPATLTPWDAGYQDRADPRALRERNAEHLDLLLRPGELAMIVVTEGSLARTLVPRPALLYPVLGYATDAARAAGSVGAATTWLGLTTPLFGRTPSWR